MACSSGDDDTAQSSQPIAPFLAEEDVAGAMGFSDVRRVHLLVRVMPEAGRAGRAARTERLPDLSIVHMPRAAVRPSGRPAFSARRIPCAGDRSSAS